MSKKNKALKNILRNPFEEEEKPDIIPLKKDVLPLPKKEKTPHQSSATTASPQGEAKSGKSVLNSRRAGPFQKKADNPSVGKADSSPYTGEPKKLSYKDKPGRTSKATLWTPQQQRAAEKKYGAQYYAKAVAEYSGFSSAEIKAVIDKKESEKPAKFLAEQKWRDGIPEEAYSKLELSALNRLYEEKRTEEFEDNLKAQRQEFENTVKSADGFKNDVHHGSQMWTHSDKGFAETDVNRAVRILNDPYYRDFKNLESADETVFGRNVRYTTDDEKQIIRALAARGDNKGFKKYYKIIERDLNARRQAAENEKRKEASKEHPLLYGVPANIASTIALPLAYGATGFQAAKNAITGKYEPTDLNSDYFVGSHVDEATRSGLEEKIREKGGGDVAVTLMDAGLGIGKNLVALPLGPTGALVSMGLSSAGSEAYDAQKRGATPGKAFAYATAKGALEASTEKIPLDNLFDIAKSAGKSAVKEVSEHGIKGALKSAAKVGREALPIVAKQSVIEGLEEVASNIGGNALDMAILGDKSNFNLLVEKYKKARLPEAEARRAANFDLNVKGTVQALLGGVFSGGFMSTGAYSLGKVAGRSRGLPVPQFDEKIDFNDPNVGLVSDDYVANNLSKRVAESLDIVARALGVKVKFADEVDGGNANAEITGNEITIEKFNSNPLEFLLGHEVTHYMQEVSPAEYDAFKSAVLGEADVQAEAERLLSLYKEKGKNISADGALDEAVANYAGKLIRDTKVLDNFINKHRGDRNMLQRVWDGIRRVAAKLTGVEKRRAETAQGKLLAALEATTTNKNTAELSGESRFLFKGYDEKTGRGIYEGNFPKGTPKTEKAKRILSYIQNVWSKKPITLVVKNDDGTTRTIQAQFDPTYDPTLSKKTDASKLMGGNRHGTSSEQRVTLNLADDYYQILSEAEYNGHEAEKGKKTEPHKDVKEWHYFINEILYQEYGETEVTPYTVTINIKEKPDGNFVYSYNAEKEKEANTRRTLHAAENQTAKSDKANVQTSNNSIYNSQEKSNTNFEESFDNEVSEPRQSLKGSEALSDAEVSETLADIEDPQPEETERPGAIKQIASKVINTYRYLYQKTISSQAPLERLSRGQRKVRGDSAITSEDLVQQVRSAGGIVDAIMDIGMYDINGNQITIDGEKMPSWSEMCKKIPKGKEKAFNDYLLHLHNVDRIHAGKPVFVDKLEGDSLAIASHLETENPEFKSLSEEFYAWWKIFMRKWVVDGGLMDIEALEKLEEKYPHYVPALRKDAGVFETIANRGRIQTARIINEAVGGIDEVMDIRDSFATYINKFVRAQRKNDVFLDLRRFAETNPNEALRAGYSITPEEWSEETAPSADELWSLLENDELRSARSIPSGELIVSMWDGSERKSITVSPEIYEALDMLVNPHMVEAEKIGRVITGVPKGLITTHNPFFAIINMIKDVQTGYVNSIVNNPAKYTSQVARAAKEIITDSDKWKEYKALGGARGGFYDVKSGFVSSYDKKYSKKNVVKKGFQKFGDAMNAVGHISDQAVRFAEYLNYLEKHGDTPENRKKAILAAADITTNFSRSGRWTKAADSFVMYLNAGVQGIDKIGRQFKTPKSAAMTLVKGGLGGIIAHMVFEALIPKLFGVAGNDDNPYYEELSNYVKDNNYILPNIWNKDENGYPKSFYKIPKSREYGVALVGLFERTLRAIDGDEQAFKDLVPNIANNVVPANPFTANAYIADYNIWKNNRDWTGSEIVPENLKDLSPYLQYDVNTSGFSKGVAKMLPFISPMKLDEWLDSKGGVVSDVLLPMTTGKYDNTFERLALPISSAIQKKFTTDPLYSSQPINDFYDEKQETTTEARDFEETSGLPEDYVPPIEYKEKYYIKASKEMSALMKRERELINTMPNNSERKKLVDELRRKRIEIAKKTMLGADEHVSKYEKTYVPEISMLSPKAQATARTMNEKYGVSYDTFKTLSGETLASEDTSEATREKFTKALPLPVQEFVNSTKKEESNAELRRYLIFNTEGLSPEAKSELDKYLSGGELKNPIDYTDEESFYYSLLTEAKQKRYGEAHSKWGNLTKKKYYKIIDACRGLKKKADIIAELERQGFWGTAPYQFYSIVFK